MRRTVIAKRYNDTNTNGTSNPMTGRQYTYAFDPIGNRDSYQIDANSATTYVDNALNQYDRATNGTTYEGFGYDGDGNMTSDGTTTYEWDAENRLAAQYPTNHSANKIVWTYDYMNRRVWRRGYAWNGSAYNSGTNTAFERKFLFDGWNNITILDGKASDAANRSHTWGLDLSGLSGAQPPPISVNLASRGMYVQTPRNPHEHWSNLRAAGLHPSRGPARQKATRRTAKTIDMWGFSRCCPNIQQNLMLTHMQPPPAGSSTISGLHAAGGIGGLLSELAQWDSSNRKFIYCYDANGNVGQLLAVADGSIASSYEYEPFGKAVVSQDPGGSGNSYTFSTKFIVNDSLYYGERYDNWRLGRWMSRDPSGEPVSISARGKNCHSSIVVSVCRSRAPTAGSRLGSTQIRRGRHTNDLASQNGQTDTQKVQKRRRQLPRRAESE